MIDLNKLEGDYNADTNFYSNQRQIILTATQRKVRSCLKKRECFLKVGLRIGALPILGAG